MTADPTAPDGATLFDEFDPGCTAAAHETTGSSTTCDHCGVCLRCFGTRVLRLCDSGLVAAPPDTPVKTDLVQTSEGVTNELVVILEGGYLIIGDGQAMACFCTIEAYPDLGLTNDEVIARYLRQIADGPECAAKLRDQGFEVWCQMWWDHHGTAKERMAKADPDGPPMNYEWDSRNYGVSAMREIFDGVIAHASRGRART